MSSISTSLTHPVYEVGFPAFLEAHADSPAEVGYADTMGFYLLASYNAANRVGLVCRVTKGTPEATEFEQELKDDAVAFDRSTDYLASCAWRAGGPSLPVRTSDDFTAILHRNMDIYGDVDFSGEFGDGDESKWNDWTTAIVQFSQPGTYGLRLTATSSGVPFTLYDTYDTPEEGQAFRLPVSGVGGPGLRLALHVRWWDQNRDDGVVMSYLFTGQSRPTSEG